MVDVRLISLDQGALISAVSGHVDSSTAEIFEQRMMEFCGANAFSSIVLDFEHLEYISSVGLRVVLKLVKKYKNVRIVNVSLEVYEIFEVTGFTDLVHVEKALRKISVENSEIIGRGANGIVYRIDDDTIVKVYTDQTPIEDIQKEREYAKRAFIAGVPTAIPFDMVKVGEGYGIVFEMVKADTYGKLIVKDRSNLERYQEAYVRLFKTLHSAHAESGTMPKTKDIYHRWIDVMGMYYSADQQEILRRILDSIPDRDTIIHNDYHTQNVMLQGDEMLIIDMAEMSLGHPVFDFGASYFVHRYNSLIHPESVPRFLGVDADTALYLWNEIMKDTFGDDSAKIESCNALIESACCFKVALMPAAFRSAPEKIREWFLWTAREKVFSNPQKIIDDIQALVRML